MTGAAVTRCRRPDVVRQPQNARTHGRGDRGGVFTGGVVNHDEVHVGHGRSLQGGKAPREASTVVVNGNDDGERQLETIHVFDGHGQGIEAGC